MVAKKKNGGSKISQIYWGRVRGSETQKLIRGTFTREKSNGATFKRGKYASNHVLIKRRLDPGGILFSEPQRNLERR